MKFAQSERHSLIYNLNWNITVFSHVHKSLAYTLKGCTPVEELTVLMRTPIILLSANAYMHNCLAIAFRPKSRIL